MQQCSKAVLYLTPSRKAMDSKRMVEAYKRVKDPWFDENAKYVKNVVAGWKEDAVSFIKNLDIFINENPEEPEILNNSRNPDNSSSQVFS